MPTPLQPTAHSATLWDTVVQARAEVARQRGLPPGGALVSARAALLHALEAYVESLTQMGRPTPYALRDELRLQRLTGLSARQMPGYR
jgi:hypothetical protein